MVDDCTHFYGNSRRAGFHDPCGFVTDSGADKRPLPSNAPQKQAATLKQKRSLQAL